MPTDVDRLPFWTRFGLGFVYSSPLNLWILYYRTLGVRIPEGSTDPEFLVQTEAGSHAIVRYTTIAMPVGLVSILFTNLIVAPTVVFLLVFADLSEWMVSGLTLLSALALVILSLGPFLFFMRKGGVAGAGMAALAKIVEENPAAFALLRDYPRTRYSVGTLVSRRTRLILDQGPPAGGF